jgi:exodeoxyribonuclease VII small subunit
MTFEETLSALSEITKKLETGNLSLEESVALYQKGITLSTQCAKQLEQAQLQILNHPEQEAEKI